MSKVFIEETTLTAIGDAIREKTGKSDLIAPGSMPDEIASITTGGGGGEVEPIVLSKDCSNACIGEIAGNYIKMYGDTISTKDITNANNMFKDNTVSVIPFDINFQTGSRPNLAGMFRSMQYLTKLPKIENIKVQELGSIIWGCRRLQEIPEDWMDTWDFSYIDPLTYGNKGSFAMSCYSLRKMPKKILDKMGNGCATSPSYNAYYYFCYACYTLDELIGVPVLSMTITQNFFLSTAYYTYRLKNFTFVTNEDGTAKQANWKNQTISLNSGVGYGDSLSSFTNYNSGLTADKEVYNDETYQALKDNPDWFTCDVAYSRYNHDSAVATINSLPDTSAYLATAGGTNTIMLRGVAGEKTDGGAINTLTEEEIAVAAAKGWTVTIS